MEGKTALTTRPTLPPPMTNSLFYKDRCTHSKTTKLSPPKLLPGIKRKSCFKNYLKSHSRKMLQTGTSTSTICYPKPAVKCTFLGYENPIDIPKINSLICLTRSLCLFLHGSEVWGAAYQRKYLDRLDRFFKRAHRFGFTTKKTTTFYLINGEDSM